MNTQPNNEITKVLFERQPSYCDENPNRWLAKVDYKGNQGEISVLLDPAVAERLLTVIAPVIVEFSRRATETIAADIEKQVLALNSPPINVIE